MGFGEHNVKTQRNSYNPSLKMASIRPRNALNLGTNRVGGGPFECKMTFGNVIFDILDSNTFKKYSTRYLSTSVNIYRQEWSKSENVAAAGIIRPG